MRSTIARKSEETIVSDLTYDLRSGVPDFVDKLVASTFGTMALEAVLDNQSGLMAALVERLLLRWRRFPIRLSGRGTSMSRPCTTPSATVRTTPIRLGLPIFLTRG